MLSTEVKRALQEIKKELPFLAGLLAAWAVFYILGLMLGGKTRIILLMFATFWGLGAAFIVLKIFWELFRAIFEIDTTKVILLVGAFLAGLFLLLVVVVLIDDAISTYRGWTNREGTKVDSYALSEKQITSQRELQSLRELLPAEKLPEWRIVNVYHILLLCDIDRYFKQRAWLKERQRKLKSRVTNEPDSPLLYSADELPESRYYCLPITMLYRPGQGWGIF